MIIEPGPQIVLPVSGLTPVIVEIVQPKDTGDDTCAIIDSEKMLIIFLDVEDDGASHGYLGQQVLIPEDEKDLAGLLILLTEHVVVLNGQVLLAGLRVFLCGHDLFLSLCILRLTLISLVIPISQWENVPIYLDYMQREIKIG